MGVPPPSPQRPPELSGFVLFFSFLLISPPPKPSFKGWSWSSNRASGWLPGPLLCKRSLTTGSPAWGELHLSACARMEKGVFSRFQLLGLGVALLVIERGWRVSKPVSLWMVKISDPLAKRVPVGSSIFICLHRHLCIMGLVDSSHGIRNKSWKKEMNFASWFLSEA